MSDEKHPGAEQSAPANPTSPETEIHHSQGVDNGYANDPYAGPGEHGDSAPVETAPALFGKSKQAPAVVASTQAGGSYNPPAPPSKPPADEEDDEEDGMARMSFLEHLEELRTRIIRVLIGFGASFAFSLIFANEIWRVISSPALIALKNLGYNPAYLVAISPMEQFSIIWVKAPMIVSIFLASPVLVWQIWGFIAPGLYKRERRWAAPFIICTSGLFIVGGLFAYFVVFRFGLEFLLGIGKDSGVAAMVTISEYFDLFVNVTLGVGVVFELPVAIFFLTLIKVASPKFLLSHSRYAILGIMILAAIITPTPDIFNLMLFTVPMILLYFIGLFASYLLELSREGKSFPWRYVFYALLVLLAVTGGAVWLAVARFGFKLVPYWPFLTQ